MPHHGYKRNFITLYDFVTLMYPHLFYSILANIHKTCNRRNKSDYRIIKVTLFLNIPYIRMHFCVNPLLIDLTFTVP